MKIFWYPQSRASRLVWMAEETGVDYEIVKIDLLDKTAPRDPDFVKGSPMGKVPALADGNVTMCESAAMCLYLADRYAAGRLAPPIDSDARGAFLYWLFYTPAVIEPAMSEQASGAETNKGQRGWGDFDTMISVFAERMADRDWVLDSGFSAADVMLGSSVVFLRMFKMLPEVPVLSDYADRCMARPAFKKAMSLES